MTDDLEKRFPAIAAWIQDGWIEIGVQEWTRSSALANDCGGMVYEETKRDMTLTECLESLERGLREYMKEHWGDESD